ncbi:MAG: formylglycine-generating enzyme family protein [Myxococcales bacterium FL481]|nr:MAG: formylglycine-generating enzyme family protein [Myxococcales bacterium FL481]
MIAVPSGAFIYGRDDIGVEAEIPRSFQMSKFPITTTAYANMLNWSLDNGHVYVDEDRTEVKPTDGKDRALYNYTKTSEETRAVLFRNGRFEANPSLSDHPMQAISWHGAAFYANMVALSKGHDPYYDQAAWTPFDPEAGGWRLPTDMEWEYSAGYNDAREYPWGDEEIDEERANYGNTGSFTNAVTENPTGQSQLGFFGFGGNVADWTDGIDLPAGVPTSSNGRINTRGGTWNCEHWYSTTYHQWPQYPETKDNRVGFRLVWVGG